MVSSVAAAVSDLGLDAADHYLDCQHFPDLRHVALAHTWASVGGASWVGHAGGIRMRGSRCHGDSVAPNNSTCRAAALNRLASSAWKTQPKYRQYHRLIVFLSFFCFDSSIEA